MFWRFGGYANSSSIDTILDKPDVTVEELLDESDLIQELKQQNSKLIEFLREEKTLHKLLHYITADKPVKSPASSNADEGSAKSGGSISFFGKARRRSRSKSVNKPAEGEDEEEKNEAQRRKYAYVACEVLSSDVWSITEALLEYKNHLREFWEYLRRDTPLDAMQASYFTKVNETLLDKKTEEMIAFLRSLDGIVPEMLKHVDCPTVLDLVLKLISLEKHDGGQGVVDWLQSQGLIPILLSYLSPENSLATQTAAGDFLKAIITISANATAQDQTVIGPNELTRQLVSEKCMSQLIDDMLKGGNPLTVGVGIVIEVIRKNNSDYDLDNQVGPDPRTSDPIYLGAMLRQFADRVPDFMTLIRSPQATKPGLKAAFGEKIQPLGFDRFKTCELMAELLHCSNMGLLNERGSEAEMRQRDADRERLKTEGKLAALPAGSTSETDEPFASSVDSHGFHHAHRPNEERGHSPENVNRLEIQNASDEDGYEKVAVPETEALPDDVTFDDFNEKLEEFTLPPPPLDPKKDSEKGGLESQPAQNQESTLLSDLSDQIEDLDLSEEDTIGPEGKRRVSLLTRQIQDQIEDSTPSSANEQQVTKKSNADAAAHPEDKPAPLFASKPSLQKGVDPILGPGTPEDEQDPIVQSTATLQPEDPEHTETMEHHAYEVDFDSTPVVGDLLKIRFVEHQVVPTILDFFFRFPWNNFLHNVVYDVVQQVFNGTLERGYNRTLALNLFERSGCPALASKEDVTQRVLDGQRESDLSQEKKGMRLGYMGHLTLIAEEVCKFVDRHPPELLGEQIMERTSREEWVRYVEGTLTETRDKDNAVLGGVRPENAVSMRNSMGAGMGGGFAGNGNSSALANAGLGGGGVPADSLELQDARTTGGFEINAGTSGLLSGFGDGEDDDEDEGLEDERREKAVSDDEQTNDSPTGLKIPPPLNIPPSRARRQLAARLAARHKEAKTIESDPDAADSSALETAASLPAIEPLGNESFDTVSSPTHMRESGAGTGLRSTPGGAERFGQLFTTYRSEMGDDSSSEDDSDSSDSGSGDSDLEDVGQAGRSDSGSPSAERRRRSREARPVTTEAKTRMSIDDEDLETGAGRDESFDAGHEGEGPSGDEGEDSRGHARQDSAGSDPFADGEEPPELHSSDEEDMDSDESEGDVVEIRPRRTS